MIKGKRVVVVMPAYNAEHTIEKTWREVLDQEIVDLVIVVDDASRNAAFKRIVKAALAWRVGSMPSPRW